MTKTVSAAGITKKTLIYLFTTLLALIFLFPFFFMITKSLMSDAESGGLPVRFFPTVVSFHGYSSLLTGTNYLRYLGNTLIIIAFNIIAIPLSASLCAFAFSKVQWQGRNIVFSVVLATMMLPGVVTQIPVYVMFARLGWLGTRLPLMIPSAFGGGALNIFLIRQFMRGIPNEIDNAAKIEGANLAQRCFLITVPLCLPVILFTMVGVFNSTWSDFQGPLIYLRSEKQFTLAVGIFNQFFFGGTTGQAVSYPNIRAAAGVLMSVPPAILFFIFQKQLIEGVAVSGLKV